MTNSEESRIINTNGGDGEAHQNADSIDATSPPSIPGVNPLWDGVTRVKGWIEPSAKLAALIAGLCYAMGFVVLNSGFSRYGFSSLEFFRVGYVAAGLWAFLVLLILGYYFRLLWRLPSRVKGKIKTEKFLLLVINIIGIPSLLIVAGGNLHIQTTWELLLAIALALYCIFCWQGLMLHGLPDPESKMAGYIMHSYAEQAIAGFATLLGFLYLFGHSAYMDIPVHFGGGQPAKVLIVCNRESKGFYEFSGIRLSAGSKYAYIDSSLQSEFITEPLGLLAKSDEDCTVVVSGKDSSYAVSIKKELVSTIIYARSVVVGTVR